MRFSLSSNANADVRHFADVKSTKEAMEMKLWQALLGEF